MSATNHTANYNLPQFIGSDKPAWLVDFNGAMADIDSAIYAAKSQADATDLVVTGHTSAIEALQTTVSDQGTAITGLRTDVYGNTGSIRTINSLIGNGAPTTSEQTIIGAINAIESTIAPSEDGSNIANAYQVGDQFMRGGVLYTALTSIVSGTAWASLILNTNYEVADNIVEQISAVESRLGSAAQPLYAYVGEDVFNFAATTETTLGEFLTNAINAHNTHLNTTYGAGYASEMWRVAYGGVYNNSTDLLQPLPYQNHSWNASMVNASPSAATFIQCISGNTSDGTCSVSVKWILNDNTVRNDAAWTQDTLLSSINNASYKSITFQNRIYKKL